MKRVVLGVLVSLVATGVSAREYSSPFEHVIKEPVALDLAAKRPNISKVRIDRSSSKIDTGKDLGQLLNENKIVPDADSYSLIYRLNSKIDTSGKFIDAVNIDLPKIYAEGTNLEGYKFRLVVDNDLKKSLTSKLKEMNQVTKSFNEKSSHIEQAPEEKARLKNAIDEYAKLSSKTFEFTVGEDRSQPVSREFYSQLDDDLRFGNSLVSKISASKQLAKQDLDKLLSVTEDLRIKADAIASQQKGPGEIPGFVSQAELQVSLNMDQSQSSIVPCPYRVHYATVAGFDRHEDHKFQNPANPATQMLERGNYVVWAVRDSDGKLATRENQEVPVKPPQAKCTLTIVMSEKNDAGRK